MAVKIELKRSAVPGKVPTTTQLDLGEMAINTYDAKVYFKQDNGVTQSIVQLATTAGSGSSVVSASHADYADNAGHATNADYATAAGSALTAVSASHAVYADIAISSSYALSSSYSISSSYAVSASHAPTALTASYAISASHANASDTAISSSYSLSGSYAISASHSDLADVAITAYTASSADNFYVRGNITASNALINGTVTAQTLNVQYITSSTEFITGSTKFGSQLTDTHQFTGSVTVTGSLSLNGYPVITSNQTGSLSVLSASYAKTASYVNPLIQDVYITGTLSTNLDILAPGIDGTSFGNAKLAVYGGGSSSNVLNIYGTYATLTKGLTAASFTGSLFGTASQAVSASHADIADSAITSSNAISSSYAITASVTTQTQFTGSFSGSINNLQGIASYVPYFSSSQVLITSSIYQMPDRPYVVINQTNVDSQAPEALYVWQPNTSSYNVISGKGNLNNYLQLNIQNLNSGTSASSDVVATANNGSETSLYIDMGINGENFIDNGNSVGSANDAYLYSTGNNLHIGNASTGSYHLGFFVGGFNTETNKKLQLNGNDLHSLTGSLNATQGFTGSLFGTASWAVSASHAPSALTSSFAVSSSYAVSASYTVSSSNAVSSSYTLTASYANTSTSASYAISSSHADTSDTAISASYALTASYAVSASNSISSSYALTSTSASHADNADNAISSSFAISSSNAVSSSFAISSSYAVSSSYSLSGSYADSSSYSVSSSYAVTASHAPTALTSSNAISASYALTASYVNHLYQDVQITGSLNTTGSNTLIGVTYLTGALNVSGSETINGYIQFQPVTTNINSGVSASYIYVSGSTNDLYFTQNGAGFSNTTRLRWLEGNLYTGLLNGGLISTASSTTFNISSGSGIIVNLNASYDTNPYPTVQYLNWPNLTNQSLTYLTSSIQTFVGINSSGGIIQQTTPWNDGQYNTSLSIGTVLHQNQTTINGFITYPNVAYGYKQRTYDFIKAFGPLKLSGLPIYTSSSLGLTVGSGTAWADGRNYTVDPNNPSYITDPGTNVSKIFRYYQSGSGFVQDTNGGLGYTVINPTLYNPNGSGSLQPVPGSGINREWSIQRVFWYPNSATKGIVVYYGSQTYASETDAAANISYEEFLETPNTQQNAVYLGALVVRNNADFNDSTSYKILPGGIFRSVGGSGGGGSAVTQTLSGLSDVDISGPTNLQPLAYSSTLTKWVNTSFLSASISGNAQTANSSSYAATASYVDTALTASFVVSSSHAISSSYSLTASYALNVPTQSVSASYATTASYSLEALSASFAAFAISSSFATTASFALNGGGGGISAIYIQDEGVTQGTASYFNFQGAGVTATVFDGTASINVPGGGSGGNTGGSSILNQTSPAVTWSFAHNLGTLYPVFTVYDSNDNVIIPQQIHAIDSSSAAIYFSTARTGTAVASKGGNVLSSSFATSASYAVSSSYSTTSSYSVSSSYSLTASYALNVPLTASNANTASYAFYAVTASYALNVPTTASNANTASYAFYAVTSSYAATASYVENTNTSSLAITASYALTASSATTFNIGGSQQKYAVVNSSVVGTSNLFTQATGSFTSGFYKYTITSASNARSGEVWAVWNNGNVQYTDNSTVDIGTTTAVTFSVDIISSQAQFNAQTNTSDWNIKSFVTYM